MMSITYQSITDVEKFGVVQANTWIQSPHWFRSKNSRFFLSQTSGNVQDINVH
jgi:hypothetical protein